MAVTYTPITTFDFGSNVGVTFSNIPQIYTDLVIVYNGRNAQGGNNITGLLMWVNGDESGSNSIYSSTYLEGNGTTAVSNRQSTRTYWTIAIGQNDGATTYRTASAIINLGNYSNTSTFKTAISQYGSTSGSLYSGIGTHIYRSTNAITSIYIRNDGGYGHNTGSTISLYGIKSA
jgi:hypothetical protein